MKQESSLSEVDSDKTTREYIMLDKKVRSVHLLVLCCGRVCLLYCQCTSLCILCVCVCVHACVPAQCLINSNSPQPIPVFTPYIPSHLSSSRYCLELSSREHYITTSGREQADLIPTDLLSVRDPVCVLYMLQSTSSVHVLPIPHVRVVSTNIYPVAVVRSSPLAIANQSTVAS